MKISEIASFTSMCIGLVLGHSMASYPLPVQFATGLVMAANVAIIYSVLKLALSNDSDDDESDLSYPGSYEGDYTVIRTVTKDPYVESLFDRRLFCPSDALFMYRFKNELVTVYDKSNDALYNYTDFMDAISPDIIERSRTRIVDYIGQGHANVTEYISQVYALSVCNGMYDYIKQNAFYQEVQKNCSVTKENVNTYLGTVSNRPVREIVDEIEHENPDAPRFETTPDDDRIGYVLTPNGDYHGDACHTFIKSIKGKGAIFLSNESDESEVEDDSDESESVGRMQ
jgi:hypothetical protein